MSVVRTVFLSRDRLPTAEAWTRGLRSHGFDLQLDPTFDPARHSGYLPCTYQSNRAGFEYEISATVDYLNEQHLADSSARLGARDTAVSFRTQSSFADLKVASI